VNKGTGFIPEKNKFTENGKNVTQVNNLKLNINEKKIDNESNVKQEENIVEKPKIIKSDKIKNKENDKNYLNDEEKDGLYSLMGLVTNNNEKERDCSILSVEYLFDTKFKNDNKVSIIDKQINDELMGQAHNMQTSKQLKDLLDSYNKSIDKKIIISNSTLILLINQCLK
jgi:hypothetical protein